MDDIKKLNNLELTTMQLDPKYSGKYSITSPVKTATWHCVWICNDRAAMTGQHMGSVAKMQNVITNMVNN